MESRSVKSGTGTAFSDTAMTNRTAARREDHEYEEHREGNEPMRAAAYVGDGESVPPQVVLDLVAVPEAQGRGGP